MKNRLMQFLKDESGQTTTEYVLILFLIVTLCMQLKSRVIKILNKLFEGMESKTTDIMSDDGFIP
jgi:Flp pilus assembly pilin Flp